MLYGVRAWNYVNLDGRDSQGGRCGADCVLGVRACAFYDFHTQWSYHE